MVFFFSSYPALSSSRSGSESPKKDNMEFIMEFEGESAGGDEESWMEMEHSSPQGGNDSAKSRSVVTKTGAAPQQSHLPQTSERSSHLSGTAASKMSLTERLKQRMRQGMDQSGKFVGQLLSSMMDYVDSH
jgi:hypothetical protein